MIFKNTLPCLSLFLSLLLIQCESIKYQYWDSGKVKVKEVRNNQCTTMHYYDENGRIIVDKIINKNGTYTKRRYSDSGKIDTKEIFDIYGLTTEYKYYPDGSIYLESVFDEIGLILLKNFHKGILISEDRFFNNKKHGLCSRFYCQDGSLKYQCIFKNGDPYNGIWQFDHFWQDVFFKYTDGKKDRSDFQLKEFPYTIDTYYNITPLKDSCFKLNLTINTSTTTCEKHGDGEIQLKNAKITGYDSTCIKLIDLLTFKVIFRKNSWILLQGLTDDGTLYLDSIRIKIDTSGIRLNSEYTVIPGTGTRNDFRTLSAKISSKEL